MTTPATATEIPCCSPATAEQLSAVQAKVGDARADILVGQGHIMKTTADYATSILQDANVNQNHIVGRVASDTQFLTGVAERGFGVTQSQIDKYGLANLNTTRDVGDKVSAGVDRQGFANLQATHGESDKLGSQANTIAWNQLGVTHANFAEARAQNERINDAQSAMSDRSFKYLQGEIGDSFARLSQQGENAYARQLGATFAVDKQVLKSEISLGKASADLAAGIRAEQANSYARLSEQNCGISKEIAAATAKLAECCCETKQLVLGTSKELGLQAANNFGAIQLEAAKNAAAIQLEQAKAFAIAEREQAKQFAIAAAEAARNKCELEAKLAACCCEIKEAVGSSAAATQSLIQAQEANRVRDALAAASTENAILKLRREEHHHHPHYPYPYPFPFPPGPPGPPGGR